MIYKMFIPDKLRNGDIVLKPKKLQELLDDAYNQGFKDGKAVSGEWSYSKPYFTPPYDVTFSSEDKKENE